MKILAGVFNPIAYDGRVQRESEALAEIGSVTIVCPDGPPIASDVPVSVVPVVMRSDGFLRRYSAFCRAFLSTALRLKPDVIHAHDYFMAAPGALASRLTGARLVYDAHELIVPEPGVRRKSLVAAFAALERIAISRADLVIAANAERGERMVEHYGMAVPTIIRNIPRVRPSPPDAGQNPPLDITRSAGEFILIYQGHLKLRRGLQRILEALERLPARFRLIVVGTGPDEQELIDQIGARGLEPRVRHVGRVPRESLRSIMQQCDAGVLTYSYDTLNDRLCAPNKVYEYSQAGLPVLATDQVPLSRIMNEYGIGRLIPREADARAIARIIEEMGAQSKPDYEVEIRRFLLDHRWETEASRLQHAVRQLRNGAAL